MKSWICHNLLGENPENINAFQMAGGLSILAFLVGSWIVLFIVAPIFAFLG